MAISDDEEVAVDFAIAVGLLLESGAPAALREFGSYLDAVWITDALEETGTATVRRRKLPATVVVWLVIAMALFRDYAIQTLVTHLRLVLPSGRERSP